MNSHGYDQGLKMRVVLKHLTHAPTESQCPVLLPEPQMVVPSLTFFNRNHFQVSTTRHGMHAEMSLSVSNCGSHWL